MRFKKPNPRNNRIKEIAIIINMLISNPTCANSNPTIDGIKVTNPERIILLIINNFLMILSLKYRFL